MARRYTEADVWALVDRSGGADTCWPWLGYRNAHGYGDVHFNGRRWRAHRLVFFLVKGKEPNVGAHGCDNPSHVADSTQQQNLADCVAKGRHARGSKNGHAKLNEQIVQRVLARPYVRGDGVRLSKELGISRSIICQIRKRQIWRHVNG